MLGNCEPDKNTAYDCHYNVTNCYIGKACIAPKVSKIINKKL